LRLFVAYCIMYIDIQEADSLKVKRNLLRSVKQRIRHDFNVSIAETGLLHTPVKGMLAAVSVSADRQYLEGQMSKMLDAVERRFPGRLADNELIVRHIEE